jgi:hypothetical protein
LLFLNSGENFFGGIFGGSLLLCRLAGLALDPLLELNH